MNGRIITITKIYGTIILSAVLLFLLFSLKKEQDLGRVEINPTFLGISLFKYGLPISNLWLARAILLCLSMGVLSNLILMDYSKFFPDRFDVEVFFDPEGTRDSLQVFSKNELKKLKIPNDYAQFQNRYHDDVNAEIRKILHQNKDFVLPLEHIHSSGDLSFVVDKLPRTLRYYIRKSEGKLTHLIERPNMPMLQFKSFFEKLSSRHDYLIPTLKELFIKHKIILQPRFKQIFAENLKSEGKSFHHTLVALTKTTVFPFPAFSNTIFLMQLDNVGLIPIAYAIYR